MADLNIAHVRILTTFSDASTREYIISGENLPTVLGKISKFMKTSAGEITGNNFAEVFNDYTNNSAFGNYSHAEGSNTIAFANYSHSEGNSTSANGVASHAEGTGTTAGSANQHVQGRYNVADNNDTFAFIIGNGTDTSHRSNAMAIGWDGKFYPNNSATGIDLTAVAEPDIISDTTSGWDKKQTIVSKQDCIYIWTDYRTIDGTVIPGIKVGDGSTKVVDLPFITDWIESSLIVAKPTSDWDNFQDLKSKRNCLYIWTDYRIIDGNNIPGVKIGDGTTNVVDLPFITDWIIPGLVTDEERLFWNNKITAYMDSSNAENLILSKQSEPTT